MGKEPTVSWISGAGAPPEQYEIFTRIFRLLLFGLEMYSSWWTVPLGAIVVLLAALRTIWMLLGTAAWNM